MTPSIPAFVEPSVLRWARESIGLTPLAAARKLDLPAGRVADWEAGTVRPTIAQLRRAASLYKRPLGVFFLPEPPQSFDAMRDFRRLPESTSGDWSPDLHADYRRAHAQRDNALELSEIEEEPPSTRWQIPTPGNDEALAAEARRVLLDIAPLPLPGRAGSVYDHLNTWVAALEEAGVLVMATTGGRVPVQEMRAFSLYFDILPVIVVNGSDGPRGRLFSLLHEYAHLLLHTSGLCDATTDLNATTPNRRLEARCNAIAAAMLMPADQVLTQPAVVAREHDPESWDFELLTEAAAPFGVSAEAFLRRLLTLGRTTREFYQASREEFLAEYERQEALNRSGGGSWYRNAVRDRGKGYVRRVADAHRRRVIDSYTAASFLDVKVEQIPKLAEHAALRGLA
jgi:Zn-dependent peptidase ImmA (M78 family)